LTPAEAATALVTCLPEARKEIETLLSEYQPAYYGTAPANLEKVRLAASTLRQKARQAHPTGWFNRRMDRGKFVLGE
jgi:hypothetical protein